MNENICSNCALKPLCLPQGLTEQEMAKVSALVGHSHTIKRGEAIFKKGDSFSHIYAVRQGSFKSVSSALYHREQIDAFYFAGELFGFDAIYDRHYLSSVIALEQSTVCEIAFDRLLTLAGSLPELQKQLFRLMSQTISCRHQSSRQLSAMESFCVFLQSVSMRFSRRGCSASDFALPMSREDIGNYLGLAGETISRLLKELVDEGILQVERRHIHIANLRALQIKACHASDEA